MEDLYLINVGSLVPPTYPQGWTGSPYPFGLDGWRLAKQGVTLWNLRGVSDGIERGEREDMAKLYLEVESERTSKHQIGNKYLEVKIYYEDKYNPKLLTHILVEYRNPMPKFFQLQQSSLNRSH